MPNLVGIGLSQVPTNSMLGGLAYQDPEHASIKDLDLKNLSQINSETSDTATDIFVYDTRKDSDGGAWRKRTTHTSWYNETLGTATRGTRREFPAVAVLVLSANKLTIYDGDDPDLSMWMDAYQFVNGGSSGNTTNWHGGSGTFSSVAALNGTIVCGATGGCRNLHFINDRMSLFYTPSSGNYTQLGGISTRNDTYSSWGPSDSYYAQLVAAATNDVAMTVLPNAPIDDATGLPIPTIAVGTDGGLSVIRDDGNVFDIVYSSNPKTVSVAFNSSGNLHFVQHDNDVTFTNVSVPSQDHSNGTAATLINSIGGSAYHTGNSISGNTQIALLGDLINDTLPNATSGSSGLTFISNETPTGYLQGAVAYATTSYNTGWMHGDIKGAFLSDTDIEDNVELVTNGTFNTNTTGWTVNGGGSVTVSSGQAQMTNNGTNNCSLDQSVTTVVGKTYEVSATITPQGGGPLPRLYVGSEFVQVGSNANSAQTVTLTYVATSTSTLISVNANTNVNNAVTIFDNVTMKLTNDVKGSELITNGTFDSNANGWSGTLATISHQTNKMRVTNTATNGWAYQGFSVASGKKYVATINLTSLGSASNLWWRIGTDSNPDSGSNIVASNINSTGVHTRTFTATQSTLYFIIRVNGVSGNYLEVDDISVRLAEEDRSVNDNGLAVYGTITKSAVATGADLVAYSPSSNTSYLEQPYNSGLDYGTGDMYYSMWVYANSSDSFSGNTYIFERSSVSDSSNRRIEARMTTSTRLEIYANGQTLDNNVSVPANSWYKLDILRRGGEAFVYINGEYRSSTTGGAATGSLTDTSAKLVIGNRAYFATRQYGFPSNSKIALFRTGAGAPSAEQVKKMYEDEKHLFQENAKCTLYGSSDAVTALAYDEVTDQLHVGTSSGRSDFQELRRINNTTTAVTTAISAHDEFIIEQ